MKLKKTLLTLAFSIAALSSSTATTLVAYWNFNDPVTPSNTTGTGTLDVTQGAGALTWSGNPTNLVYFGGSVTNMQVSDERGLALALRNGLNGENNGSFLEFTLDLTGLDNIVLTFAAQRTSTGFTSAIPSYAVGAGPFTTLAAIPQFETGMGTTTAVPAAIRTVDFSSENFAIAGQADVKIRLTLDGGSETSENGNNRFDNVTFTSIPEPSAALLGGLGFIALLRRRR